LARQGKASPPLPRSFARKSDLLRVRVGVRARVGVRVKVGVRVGG
tara:strand:+ start:60 stop:194 length:135 start_codon:yes stop_codon:yes gene_type:complete